jgi:hypothetical protein
MAQGLSTAELTDLTTVLQRFRNGFTEAGRRE